MGLDVERSAARRLVLRYQVGNIDVLPDQIEIERIADGTGQGQGCRVRRNIAIREIDCPIIQAVIGADILIEVACIGSAGQAERAGSRRIIQAAAEGNRIIGPASERQVCLADSRQELFDAHMRRRQRCLYRPGIQVRLAVQGVGPITAAPVEGRDFDAAALSPGRPVDAVEGDALDLAAAGIKGHIPLLPVDVAGQIGRPIHGKGHERRSGVEGQVMAGKGQVRRLAVHFIRTADVDTSSCQVSMTAAQGHDAAVIGHIAGCRVDSQAIIRQVPCRHVACRHNRVILTVAGCVERRRQTPHDGHRHAGHGREVQSVYVGIGFIGTALDVIDALPAQGSAIGLGRQGIDINPVLTVNQICLGFIDGIAVISHIVQRRCTAGIHVLYRPPDRPFETGCPADGNGQIIGKGRHVGSLNVDVQVEYRRVAVGYNSPADAEVLAVDTAFDVR